MNDRIEVLDELVEAARLLGATQAKKGFGCYTDEDSRFERSMHESIAKHRAALEAALPMVVGEAVGRISGKPKRVHQFNEPVYWLYTLLVEDPRTPGALGEPVSLPPGTKLYTAPPPSAVPPYEIDALFDALSNLEHDNYERSYSGSKNREADAGLIRAALERYVAPVATAAQQQGGRAAQADGCHCATCTCKPGMTPAVRFDTSPVEREGAVRDHLIRMGWTPPQQPAAAGEEILVNSVHGVFILPLQPSGLLSGPRFVVHVPAQPFPAPSL